MTPTESNSYLDRTISLIIILAIWVTGVIMASGFWSTFFAVIFWPWSFIVVVYNTLQLIGLI